MAGDVNPKYKQIADILRERIDGGSYHDGDRMETESSLTERFRVSRQTIRQAIGLLENEGYVQRRQGSGTYVMSRIPRLERADTVAFISSSITEYIFPGIIRGAEQMISSEGLSLTLYVTENRVDNERRILTSLMGNPPRGMIIEGTKTALPNPNLSLYKSLMAAGVPIVFINGYYPDLPGSVYVVTDDVTGGRTAAEYLIAKGHRRIGGIFKSDDMQGHRRYSGYMQALVENRLELHDEDIIWYDTENMESLLFGGDGCCLAESLRGCSAVVCYNDQIAVRLIDALKSCGIRVPKQMAVVSFDNSLYSEYAAVKITSVDHPKDALGRMAAGKLIRMIKGGNERPSVMEWKLVEKKST